MKEKMTEIQEKRKLHAQLVFIHQRLTQTSQYFIDEFEVAKDAVQTITSMANAISEELKTLEAALPQVATEGVDPTPEAASE